MMVRSLSSEYYTKSETKMSGSVMNKDKNTQKMNENDIFIIVEEFWALFCTVLYIYMCNLLCALSTEY